MRPQKDKSLERSDCAKLSGYEGVLEMTYGSLRQLEGTEQRGYLAA